MIELLSISGLMFIFSINSLLGGLFVVCFIPETKEQSFQDILVSLERWFACLANNGSRGAWKLIWLNFQSSFFERIKSMRKTDSSSFNQRELENCFGSHKMELVGLQSRTLWPRKTFCVSTFSQLCGNCSSCQTFLSSSQTSERNEKLLNFPVKNKSRDASVEESKRFGAWSVDNVVELSALTFRNNKNEELCCFEMSSHGL